MICGGLASQVQWTGKHFFMFQSALHRIAHGVPHFFQIIPYFRAFTFLHIFPEIAALLLAPAQDVRCIVHVIYVLIFSIGLSLFGQSSSTNTIYSPVRQNMALGIQCLKLHSVRMERKELSGFPNNGGTVCS